jgi:hypothetical protein
MISAASAQSIARASKRVSLLVYFWRMDGSFGNYLGAQASQ